jgi:ORF6N domain
VPKPAELRLSTQAVERQIYVIRGHKVMLDSDLAALYRVPTKAFNQAVLRNIGRFPSDYMFMLTRQEVINLRSQIVTSIWGGRRHLPRAFTELGVAMLTSVLKSDRAIQMNIAIMRTFVRLREMIAANKDLAARVEKLETGQRQIYSIIEVLVDEIDDMKRLPPPSKRKIGFDL